MERLTVERVFAAVGLPPEHRMAVVGRLEPVDLPGSVVPPVNLHVTIRWFGDLDRVTFERLLAGLDDLPPPGAFRMRLGGLGAFPNPRRASVLWVEPVADGLEGVREMVDEAAEVAGIGPEDRPFRPHLTVARMRPERDVRALLAATPPLDVTVPVAHLVLLRSHLGGGPARYEALETIDLDRNPRHERLFD